MTGPARPAPARIWMRLDLRHLPADAAGHWAGPSRPLRDEDCPSLGDLAYEAYRGSVDDHGETREWHREEMAATWAGRYGVVIRPSSLAVCQDERVVAAVLATTWRSRPLLAFALTHPTARGRGVAAELIRRSAATLCGAGADEVRLAVTVRSPATRLYRRLGFTPCENS